MAGGWVSVQAVSWVLEHSRAEHSERLVLISLANHASTDEALAFPSVDTISRESRLSRRSVQGALGRLLALGEIVEAGRTRFGTRCFKLPMGGAKSAPAQDLRPGKICAEGAQNTTSGGAGSAPKPSRTIKESSGVERVFDKWVEATDRDSARTKLTPDRRRRIRNAISSHGVEDCLAAVSNIGRDQWARGDNDRGRRFDDIDHALGTTERIERWRDWKPPRTKGGGAVSDRIDCRDCGAPLKVDENVRCRGCLRALEERNTGLAA